MKISFSAVATERVDPGKKFADAPRGGGAALCATPGNDFPSRQIYAAVEMERKSWKEEVACYFW